jgi:hypothetical protein
VLLLVRLPLQEANHLLAELQVVMADKAALEDEKAAAQVCDTCMSIHSSRSMSAWPHVVCRMQQRLVCSMLFFWDRTASLTVALLHCAAG